MDEQIEERKENIEEKISEEFETYESLVTELNTLTGEPVGLLEMLALIFFVAVSDIFLFSGSGGSGNAIYVLIIITAFSFLNKKKLNSKFYFLFICIVIISLATAWQSTDFLTTFLFFSGIVYIIGIYTDNIFVLDISTLIPGTLFSCFYNISRYFILIKDAAKNDNNTTGNIKSFRLNYIIVPLFISIIFYFIFCFANPVIANLNSRIINKILLFFVSDGEPFFTIDRLLFWFAFLLIFSSLIRPYILSGWSNKHSKNSENLDETTSVSGMEYVTALITLILVNILFIIYNLLDFSYLWLNVKLPYHITYSQYSHQGVYWLTAALALSTLIIGIIFSGKNNFLKNSEILRIASYIWTFLNFIIALGALRRMQLYINWNGLISLRITGIFGVLLVISGLILMLYKVMNKKNLVWLLRRDAQVLFLGIFIGCITPMDYISAEYNVNQILSGNIRPVSWLYNQQITSESIKPVFKLLQSNDKTIKDGVSAFLLRRSDELNVKKISWKKFQLSDKISKNFLKANKKVLLDCAKNIKLDEAEKNLDYLSQRYR